MLVHSERKYSTGSRNITNWRKWLIENELAVTHQRELKLIHWDAWLILAKDLTAHEMHPHVIDIGVFTVVQRAFV